jgi:6-phosphogluconolactonase
MNDYKQEIPRACLRAAGLVGVFAIGAVVAACGGGGDAGPLSNQLYTESNETANVVIHFARQSDGTLVRQESTATGGAGTNGVGPSGATGPDSLVSQHSVIISPDGTAVYAVNAGDNSISVMSVDQSTGALTLKKKSPTAAGQTPNSLALNKGFLYATFIKGASQLAAFKVQADGTLTQIGAYDLVALGGLTAKTAAPTQVIASPDGAFVVVNAGTGSNAVLSFAVNGDGTLKAPVTSTAQISTPFAGAFVPGSAVPEYLTTGISAMSLNAYSFSSTGALSLLGQSSTTGVAAPCWLVIAPSGSVAFVGNGSGAISSYSVTSSGTALLNSTAAVEASATAGVNSVAGDSWISPDGKFLYTVYLGDDKVVAYSIGLNGSLAKLGETPIGTATKLSSQGLVGL